MSVKVTSIFSADKSHIHIHPTVGKTIEVFQMFLLTYFWFYLDTLCTYTLQADLTFRFRRECTMYEKCPHMFRSVSVCVQCVQCVQSVQCADQQFLLLPAVYSR